MRWHRSGLVASALIGLTLVACDATGAHGQPDPAAIGLQSGDLPGEFERCSSSGEIGSYLRVLQARNQTARDELASAWREVQDYGGSQAAVTVYSQQRAACDARLAAGDGPNVTSVVVRFHNQSAASDAYQRGMFGFSTPSEGAEVPGLTRGMATGVGRNAWILQRSVNKRSLMVALWQRHLIAVLFVAVDADPLHANQAIAAVDRRTA